MNKTIEVVPYDPQWLELFATEAELIKSALGDNCVAVHHIGSTSVPGLSAKPIIDMLPVVRDIQAVDQATKAMESLGYEVKGEYGIAFRRYFQKSKDVRTHNIHVYQENDPEISRYLKFRDWMRSHPADAKAYGKLKEELAVTSQDMLQYCNGKDAFVASIDAKDGYDGWRMVQALTDREWSAVRNLRQLYFFKSKEDPYTWTFNHKDHVHLVFYKNAEIIGYAHLQLWPQARAALRIIIIHEHYRHLGYASQFLKLCERWLTHRGFKNLFIQSPKAAYAFYCKQGYISMPFNDPDGYEGDPQDIEMGKFLRMSQQDRPKISIYIATSIDGYIARKDGNFDWLQYGHKGDEDYGFKKFSNSIDAWILGRNTYQVVAAFNEWPYTRKRVIVLSHTLKDVRKEAELFCGELTDLLSKLHSENIQHIGVDGGSTASNFLEAGLVDELTISIIAMVLGSGIPLFSVMSREHSCRLVYTQSYPSGVVQLKYKVTHDD
jgi:GrpB-like predicted nucleotidyltransferase (UPF0157 family)/dihydrofolate reductase